MSQFNQLSNREWEVIEQLLQGKNNKIIASSLNISVSTVEFHLNNIYEKFNVGSRLELILELWKTTGKMDIEELGYSIVDSSEDSVENGDRFTINKLKRLRNMMRLYRLILAICVIYVLFIFGSLFYWSRIPGTIIIWKAFILPALLLSSIIVLIILLPRTSFRLLVFIAFMICMFFLLITFLFYGLRMTGPIWILPYLVGAGGILVASRNWPREENPGSTDEYHPQS
jgi:DNA-binding CsgD family transcriptional regulator